MKPTREELFNAGFELEEGFESTFLKQITERITIHIWHESLELFNCSIGENLIYDKDFKLTKENLNKIHEHYTGETLNFEKKEDWKIGNVLKYVCSANLYYTGIVCKVRGNGGIDFIGVDANYNAIDCGDLYKNFILDISTKIAETPEEYYRQKFESEKGNEPKEEVKEGGPQIGEVWEVILNNKKTIAWLVNKDNSCIPYMIIPVNKISKTGIEEWIPECDITFNKKLADSYKEYKQQ